MKESSIHENWSHRSFLRTVALMGIGAALWLEAAPLMHRVLAADASSVRTLPRVPGKLKVQLRRRREVVLKSGNLQVAVEEVEWDVSETAIIICDMWANHPCQSAAQRVDAMAPKMNRVVSAARSHGVMVIHAPSGGVKHYDQTRTGSTTGATLAKARHRFRHSAIKSSSARIGMKKTGR